MKKLMSDIGEKIKVIYISGLGRSGSTLLDLILSTSPQVFSIGEAYKYNNLRNANTICGCGQKFRKCHFWSNFASESGNFRIFNRVNRSDYRKIAMKVLGPSLQHVGLTPTSNNYQLLQKVLTNAPKQTKYILDSSKEIGRLIELDEDERIDVFTLTVIRDGRGVAFSFHRPQFRGYKRKNRFVSLLKWYFMNSLILRHRRKKQIPGVTISHNAFCKNPLPYIESLEKKLDIHIPRNYTEVIKKMDYHNIGGNRIARIEKRQKFAGVQEKEKYKLEQNKIMTWLLTILAYPGNRKWVY